MARLVVATIIFLHGFIHFLVLAEKVHPSDFASIRAIHLLWFGVFAVFLLSALLYIEKSASWWLSCLAGVVVSQTLIITHWQQTKEGTLINLFLLIASIGGFLRWKFDKAVEDEITGIFKDAPFPAGVIASEKIEELPAPVRSWLLRSGVAGRPPIAFVRLQQVGAVKLNQQQKKWKRVTAEQYINAVEPAFVWKAHVDMLPFIPVSGRDKFISGNGEMNMKLLHIIPVAHERDPKIDQGALQRWLAEICWYPSAALSPYITWKEVDALTARAVIRYKGIKADMDFKFSADGDMVGAFAERYKGGGDSAKIEKWEVRSLSYATFDGIRIPTRSEATWRLDSGDFTWLKLELTGIDYNSPYPYES